MTCTCMKWWKGLDKLDSKLNYGKCVIKTKSYAFFGNVYTLQGVMLDPKKVEAIKKM